MGIRCTIQYQDNREFLQCFYCKQQQLQSFCIKRKPEIILDPVSECLPLWFHLQYHLIERPTFLRESHHTGFKKPCGLIYFGRTSNGFRSVTLQSLLLFSSEANDDDVLFLPLQSFFLTLINGHWKSLLEIDDTFNWVEIIVGNRVASTVTNYRFNFSLNLQ